jgi:transcriptional regulator with XRE-family HTH domain
MKIEYKKSEYSPPIDHKKTGINARTERERLGFSQAQVAKEMGFSAPYYHDLEHGNRNWGMNLVRCFNSAILRLQIIEKTKKLDKS